MCKFKKKNLKKDDTLFMRTMKSMNDAKLARDFIS
jgi:hypothetical protein